MIVGLTLGALAAQIKGYRLGGVMVLPILAIYTLREFFTPVIFLSGTVVAWISLWVLQEYTLNYGRQLFLSAIIVGVVTTIMTGYMFSEAFPNQLSFENSEAIATIFPGITAFNLMRVNPETRRAELLVMGCGYLALIAIGGVLLLALAGLAIPTPPLLTLSASDITTWIEIKSHASAYPAVIPGWVSLILLLVTVVIYEGFQRRYDHRLVGIIIIPTLCFFSVQSTSTVIIYAIGATAVFYVVSYIQQMTLFYGRVLLTISILLGTIFSLMFGIFLSQSVPISGVSLFFTGLFIGIGAYNLTRVSQKTRLAHIRIDAGLFVVGYTPLFVLVEIPVTGLLRDNLVFYVSVGIMIVALAIIEMYRLEQSTADAAAFASESAFARSSVDGIGSYNSPLVSNNKESK